MTEGVRQFPCTQCGAKVKFAPGTDSLECPYCGHQTAIPVSTHGIEERDYGAALADKGAGADTEEVQSVSCGSCAASVEPPASAEAFPCPYCGSSIVTTSGSQRLIKPQALLPFEIARDRATELFRTWITKLWFAPNSLKKLARLEDRLQGLYVPYWTYDADTVSRYKGQRGDNYTTTRRVTRNGKQVTETVVRIHWRPAAGTVSRQFDDVLVVGSKSLPRDLAQELEPWDLDNLVSYADEYLSGFIAERYQVDLRQGWSRAAGRMEQVIRGDAKRHIGGDHQRIHSLDTKHSALTYKHVLLPMWICSYRYKSKVYRFLVNARTGEVQGHRPWSWIKITLTALAVGVVTLMIYTALNT
jgi:DNA-directed RNA polymerase subunit RPC12/RpoP